MQRIKLKPSRPDLIVRDPADMSILPKEGREVFLTTYWHRRLKDGDVVRVDEVKPVPAPARSEEKETKGDEKPKAPRKTKEGESR